MIRKHIKTSRIIDSLGTRYHLDVMTDNGISIQHAHIGTYTDGDQVREVAFRAFSGCVDEYGMDNVYVSRDY